MARAKHEVRVPSRKSRRLIALLVMVVVAVVACFRARAWCMLAAETRNIGESVILRQGTSEGSRVLEIRLDGTVHTVFRQGRLTGFVQAFPDGSVMSVREDPTFIRTRREYSLQGKDGEALETGWFRRLKERDYYRLEVCTLLPDGGVIASVGGEGRMYLVLVGRDGSSLRHIPWPFPARSFPSLLAPSPDGSMLAFYHAADGEARDPGMPTLGLGVMDLNGEGRLLAEPSLINGIIGDRYSPPFWSPDGRAIYFTAGPEPGMEEVSYWWRPGAYCYRVDVESGRVRLVSAGDLCGIAPDGSFILLRDCPSEELIRTEGEVRRESQCWQLDVRTEERTVLPASVRYPKLSISGRYAVDPGAKPEDLSLEFYRTSDWKLLRLVSIGSYGLEEEEWPSSKCFWITQANVRSALTTQPKAGTASGMIGRGAGE